MNCLKRLFLRSAVGFSHLYPHGKIDQASWIRVVIFYRDNNKKYRRYVYACDQEEAFRIIIEHEKKQDPDLSRDDSPYTQDNLMTHLRAKKRYFKWINQEKQFFRCYYLLIFYGQKLPWFGPVIEDIEDPVDVFRYFKNDM